MIDIYTDGSARPNPGRGGWGVVQVTGDRADRSLCGGAADTTNNRMELVGLIEGIKLAPAGRQVRIWSDSSYAVTALTTWAHKWRKTDWVTKSGPVKNRDLIETALELLERQPNVTLHWLKGHNGHRWNETADELANEGRMTFDAAASASPPDRPHPASPDGISTSDLTVVRSDSRSELAEAHQALLDNIRQRLGTLERLLSEVDTVVGDGEDLYYRFWHQSLKMFALQQLTETIFTALQDLTPSGAALHPWYVDMVSQGTGRTFSLADNDRWLEVARPIVDAYLHSSTLLRLVVHYGRELNTLPQLLPSGWATLLHLYSVR